MTVRLHKGQNLAWTGTTIKVVVEVAAPTDVSALLLGANGKVRSEHDFVFYNQAVAPGVTWSTGRHQQITVDLRTLDVPSLMCLISVDPDAPALGSVAAPRAILLDENDSPVTDFLMTELTTERAVIAWEIYRRGTAWKVRAIGQGYDGGLAEAVTVHGVEVEDASPTHSITPPAHLSTAAGPSLPPAPQPPGTSDQERLYRQSVGIFEDAARSTVGYRSAVSFAEKRRDDELSAALADPSARNAPGATAARDAAQRRYEDLVSRARADHRKDIGQLSTELATLQQILPAPMSDWDAAAWRQWRPATEPAVATQAGHLYLPEAPEFQMPMMVGLPLSRPLWIDTAGAVNPGAGIVSPDDLSSLDSPLAAPTPTVGGWQAMTKALVVRFLAACPVGGIKLQIADLAGKGAAVSFLGPLNHPGTAVLAGPVATAVPELSQMLTGLIERVDLIQMARRAGSLDSLSGELDAAERLVVLTDFPYGYDDAEIAKVRFLAEEGAAAGVQLLIIGSHAEVEGRGPLVASLFRSFLRLPVEPDDHLGDGWTGTTWTFNPDMGPTDVGLLDRILGQMASARPA